MIADLTAQFRIVPKFGTPNDRRNCISCGECLLKNQQLLHASCHHARSTGTLCATRATTGDWGLHRREMSPRDFPQRCFSIDQGGVQFDSPVRSVGIGPLAYQERIRRTLVKFADPDGKIALPKGSRSAGW